MVGVAGASPSLTSQIYQKMFAQVDANADGAVSLDELVSIKVKAASDGDAPELGDVFNALDRNADGKLQAGEFVAERLFDNATLGTMLGAQEYRDADPESRAAANKSAVEALFERADIDGDGLLDQAEMEAEKALRRAETLDSGKLPDFAYLTRATEDGKLRPEDIVVGRLLPLDGLKAVQLTPEQRAALDRIVTSDAPASAGDEVKPGNGLDDLRAKVQTELDTQPLSTAMISRLFARLSAEALQRASPALPVDRTA